MRFISLYTPDPKRMKGPPTQDEMARMGKLIEEGKRLGWLVETDGAAAGAARPTVKQVGGEVTVIDGPYTEAKELIGGYAIIEARSVEHAVELSKSFLKVAGDGRCDLVQLYSGGH